MNIASIANVLSKVLSGVTTQIGGYFETGRFKRQFTIPTTAFILGCLAIAMSIIGPYKPREWWSGLSFDIKLLVMSLFVLLFVILTEINRQLTLLIRQLYSGEWPQWSWLQRFFRKSQLEKKHRLEKENADFEIAFNHLIEAKGKIEDYRKTVSPPPKEPEDFPVPNVPIGAYQLINWDCLTKNTDPDLKSNGHITSPANLVGHYSLKPLPVGKPIKPEDINTLPSEEYLDTERQIISLRIDPDVVVTHLVPGTIIDLDLPDRNEPFTDIFIADRPSPELLILSVNVDDIDELSTILRKPANYELKASTSNNLPGIQLDLKRIPGSQENIIIYTRTAPPDNKLVGVPVPKEDIIAGQFIEKDDLTWLIESGPLDTSVLATKMDEIVGRVYWPRVTGNTPGATQIKGTVFQKKDIKKKPPLSWMKYQTPQGMEKRQVICVNITDEMTNNVPIEEGDRLKISFQKNTTNNTETYICRFCYVLQKNGTKYHIAVKKEKYDSGDTVLNATPFDTLPILNKNKRYGDLIYEEDLTEKQFLANAESLFVECWLNENDVIDSYVNSKVDLKEGKPIPKESTCRAAGKQGNLDPGINVTTVNDIKRGDLVSVTLSGEIDISLESITEINGKVGLKFFEPDFDKLNSLLDDDARVDVYKKNSNLCNQTNPKQIEIKIFGVQTKERQIILNTKYEDSIRQKYDASKIKWKISWEKAFVRSVETNSNNPTLNVTIPKKYQQKAEALLKGQFNARGDINVTHSDSELETKIEELKGTNPTDALQRINQLLSGTNRKLIRNSSPGTTAKNDVITLARNLLSKRNSMVDELERISIFNPEADAKEDIKTSAKKLLSTLNSIVDELERFLESSPKTAAKEDIKILAKNLLSTLNSMINVSKLILERPWHGKGAKIKYEAAKENFETIIWNHATSINMWLETIDRLFEQHIPGLQLSLPDKLADTRSTELGNILAAAADYPRSAYNIDTASVLPRFILALGNEDKAVQELTKAEASLTMMLMFSFWSAVWTLVGWLSYVISGGGIWWMWVIFTIGGPSLSLVTKEAAVAQAYSYGEALKALFDTKRHELFKEMGLILKEEGEITPEQEKKYWKQLFQLFALGDSESFPARKLDKGDSNG